MILVKVQGYLISITSLVCCSILIMTIRHANKVAREQNYERVNSQLKLNWKVTFMHIAIIFGSSIVALFYYNFEESFTAYQFRISTALITFTALQDTFLAYNLFFILDESRRPDIIRDETRRISYTLLDLIKPKQ